MTTLGGGGGPSATSVYSGVRSGVRSSVSGASDVPGGSHKHISPHIGQIDSGEKMDADRMDEKRKEHMAYEYLCHLEEAKQWIEACIEDELPTTTELEEALRNGVILCRLGHFYAPEILPLRKIYDRDQAKYHAKGLHFKHTDNFNWWLRTLEHVGLPKIFYPITTDLYDRKNMPRVIYCIHALSLYLHKLGKAPLIEDLLGTATFTEEEISAMKLALEKYGINLPSFGKIGGILANQLSVDEAAVHAAVMAINEVLEKEDNDVTLKALKNPAACLVDVLVENAPRYQGTLLKAKRDKTAKAGAQNGDVDDSQRDVYEYMLTRDEIQRGVTEVNSTVRAEIAEEKFRNAIGEVNQAIVGGDLQQLLHSLQSEDTRLNAINPDNVQWYMDVLSKAINDKAEMGGDSLLTRDEIQDIINIANDIAEHTRLVQAAVVAINTALEEGDADSTLEALQNEHLDLSDVHPENKDYYYQGLRAKKQGKEESGSTLLTEDDIQEGVNDMNQTAEYDRNVEESFAAINYSVKSGQSAQATLHALQSEFAGLIENIREDCAEEYLAALRKAQDEKQEDLTSEEIKQIVEMVNEKKHKEELKNQAVGEINSCLDGMDSTHLLQALLSPHAGLDNVQESNALHYLNVLAAMKKSKEERMGESDATLTEAEIQAGIDKANEQTLEAIELVKAVSVINWAVDSGDSAATLVALQAPAANLRSITEECAADYTRSLAEAKSQRVGEEGDGWAEHRTREGHAFYYNWKSEQSQWEKPENLPEQSSHLRRQEIQVVVTKVTADFDRWTLLKSNEPLITQLQARIRGTQCRKSFLSRLDFLGAHEKQAVALQAHWKGSKQRKAYRERLAFLNSQATASVKLQSFVRMWRARKAHQERLQFLRDNVAAVVKIQAFWRAKTAKRDYKQLVEVDQPPASSVRRFLALLEQSDIDFSEELECQRLKAQVVQEIRSNQQLEQDVLIMDIKIGLLVKNRISLEDVVTHSTQIKKERRKGGASVSVTGGDSSALLSTGLGGLTKANQQRLEAYQHLFYLLQTNPNYFAKLIFEMPQSKTNRFMENVILTVFNYAQNNREQFLLVKLFERALKEEVQSKVDRIMDIVTGNPTVIKMVIHYTRGERGHNVLQDLLGPLVKEVLEAKDLMLVTSPVDVYRAWINQMESETGEATKLPYDVSNDQALEHQEVKDRIRKTIQQLCSFCDRFQASIMESVQNIPYAMRFIAMQLRLALGAKFPDAPQDDILKVVGNLLYYRYMNPAIVAPDAFDVVEMGVEHQLGAEQRRNLGAIAKILQTAAAGKNFEGENSALSNVNEYLAKAFEKFKVFFLQASTVASAEEKFGIDEYSDVIMLTKPVIYISVKEICSTHSLLIEHEAIAPDPSDPLREILRDLGPAPSVEAFLGGVREAAPGEDKQDVINEAGKQEIPLTLVNKFEGLAQDDSSDMRALFVRTKRMVVDVLKVQPGDNLTEILYTPATPEQVTLKLAIIVYVVDKHSSSTGNFV
jgi:Ras GTPase-activating-like protein IQGAP1